MKKYFLFYFLFCFTKAYSQVSFEYLKIITSAAQYTYIGVTYRPDDNWIRSSDWNTISDLLSARQEMYERGHSICRNEYVKLMNLVLINQSNKIKLASFQEKVKRWAEANYRNIDLSIQSNVNAVLKYYTALYDDPDIRNEIKLLNELNAYYQEIANSDPKKINKGVVYDHINTVIQEIKTYTSKQLTSDLSNIIIELRQRKYNEFKNYVYKRFYNISKSPKVSNGWHFVYFIEKNGLSYGQRSVFVENGKVTIFKTFNGEDAQIISGGSIVNQYCQSAVHSFMDARGVFKNADLELFFMD